LHLELYIVSIKKSYMKIICVQILFFTIAFSLNAQERLTDFEGIGSALRNFIKTVDGKNYLIQIHADDKIETYEILSAKKKNLIQTTFIDNIYNENFNFYKGHIIYDQNKFIYAYNYITNSIVEVMPIADEYDIVYFNNLENKKLLIYFIQTSVKTENYLFDFGDSPKKIDRYWYYSSDYFITNFQDSITQENHLIKYNVETEMHDTFPVSCIEYQSWQRYKDEFYFIDCNNEILKIDLTTNQGPSKFGLKFGDSGTKDFLISDSLVISRSYYNDGIPPPIIHDRINIYNKDDLTLIRSYKDIIGGSKIENISVIDSFVIIQATYDLIILDVNKNRHTVHESQNIWNKFLPQFTNNNILNYDVNYDTDEAYFEEIELSTRNIKRVEDKLHKYYRPRFSENVQFRDTILFTTSETYYLNRELLIFNRNENSIKNHIDFDKSQTGFFNRSIIYKIGKSVVVIQPTDSMYVYKNNSFDLLTTEPINYRVVHKIIDDKLLFKTLESKIFSFDGEELSLKFDANEYEELKTKNIRDYSVHGDYTYILENTEKLLILNNKTKDYEIIEKVKTLYTTKYFTYYYNNQGLWATNGQTTYLINPPQSLNENFYQSHEKFLLTTMGIWNVDSTGIFTKIYKCEECKYRFIANLEGSDALLFFDSTYYHYDSSLEVIKTDIAPLFFDGPSMELTKNNDAYLVESYTTIPRIYRIYDFNTKSFKKVFDSGDYQFIDRNSFITINNNDFYIGRNHDGEQSYTYILTENNNEETETIETIICPDYPKVHYNKIKEVVLAAIGNKVIVIDSTNKIKFLQSVVGKAFSGSEGSRGDNVITIDNSFYFFGLDPTKGTQLYRYTIDQTNSTENISNNRKSLDIFPNPANTSISIKLEDFIVSKADRYSIYTLDGKMVQSDKFTPSIPIYELLPAIYILEIQIEGQLINGKFVKQ